MMKWVLRAGFIFGVALGAMWLIDGRRDNEIATCYRECEEENAPAGQTARPYFYESHEAYLHHNKMLERCFKKHCEKNK